MSAERTHIKSNDSERARMKALVAKCSDAELARPMPAGWTVASVLAHIAFWDQRIVVLLDQWEQKGIAPKLESEDNVDWINDAAKPAQLALPPRKAAEMTVAIAEACDRRVAAMSDDLIAKNAAAGGPLNLDRGVHRREHLDEIEKLLR